MRRWTRWQDWVSVLLGVWMIVSPWVLGVADNTTIMWNAVTVGLVVALVAIWALAQPGQQFAEWANIVLGAGYFLAPWVLGYADVGRAAWSAWIAGVAVLVMAAWALPVARRLSRETFRERPA